MAKVQLAADKLYESSHALFQGVTLPLEEEEGEDEVCNEDQNQADDNCTCS